MYTNVDWEGLRYGRVVRNDEGNVISFVEFNGRERDSYGEAYEGEGECFLIFSDGDKFYKKHGYESSYENDVDWSWGAVNEVKPKTVIKTVFE